MQSQKLKHCLLLIVEVLFKRADIYVWFTGTRKEAEERS